jgi:hypothetical protein
MSYLRAVLGIEMLKFERSWHGLVLLHWGGAPFFDLTGVYGIEAVVYDASIRYQDLSTRTRIKNTLETGASCSRYNTQV